MVHVRSDVQVRAPAELVPLQDAAPVHLVMRRIDASELDPGSDFAAAKERVCGDVVVGSQVGLEVYFI